MYLFRYHVIPSLSVYNIIVVSTVTSATNSNHRFISGLGIRQQRCSKDEVTWSVVAGGLLGLVGVSFLISPQLTYSLSRLRVTTGFSQYSWCCTRKLLLYASVVMKLGVFLQLIRGPSVATCNFCELSKLSMMMGHWAWVRIFRANTAVHVTVPRYKPAQQAVELEGPSYIYYFY